MDAWTRTEDATSPDTRQSRDHSCVASAPLRATLPKIYAPLYFSRSAATSAPVAAESVVQVHPGARMHVT